LNCYRPDYYTIHFITEPKKSPVVDEGITSADVVPAVVVSAVAISVHSVALLDALQL